MDNEIFRPMNEADKQFIDVNLNKPRRQKTSRERFQEELSSHEKAATKKHLPFARHAAREDFEAEIKKQIDAQLKEYGELAYPERLKVPEMDWNKYSDLKNFTLTKEDEVFDTNLSNRNPGLSVMVKKAEYYYGDVKSKKYRVMEEPQEAIKRAQEKAWSARQQFDNQSIGETKSRVSEKK